MMISNYKIVGRQFTVKDNLEANLYYLIRPEYRSAVRRIFRDRIS